MRFMIFGDRANAFWRIVATGASILLARATLPAAEPVFENDVRRVLVAKCVTCHDAETKSGNIDFSPLVVILVINMVISPGLQQLLG